MIRARVLLILLVVSFLLPTGLVAVNGTNQPGLYASPGLTASKQPVSESGSPGLDARKRENRKAHRRADRKSDQKERRERRRRGGNSEQARIVREVELAPPRLPALAELDDPCGAELIQLRKSARCTHGPDAAPPAGATLTGSSGQTAAAARRASADVACGDDSDRGFRVQVLYLRSSSTADNYATHLNTIRSLAADADTILQESSAAAGQKLKFTYVTTEDCQIDVDDVAISPSAIRTFDSTIQALEQQGYNRPSRIYLMFSDTNPDIYCGIGTLWEDDRDSAANYNNRGPSFSRVDRSCWSGFTAAHELMHNLGGVQYSAPNSSGYGHCIDEWDVMCYPDAPGVQMRAVCTEESLRFRFDCNNDDYFDPQPSRGSYLDTHWNTADNWFLTQHTPSGADLSPPTLTWVSPAGNSQIHRATAGVVALQAEADDDSGVAYVDFWLFDDSRRVWISLGQDTSAPYTSSVSVANLRNGLNYLVADAFDTEGNWDEQEIWIERAGSGVSLTASSGSVKVKKLVKLTATVTNPASTESVVEFRVCRGAGCTWDSGQTLGVVSGPNPSTTWKASGKGQVTFLARETSSGAGATSNPATISVKKAKKKH